jgi:antitoxin StbD
MLKYILQYTAEVDMVKLLTSQTATITEMREPHKVLERAQGRPVAILRNSSVVGYLVPNDAVDTASSTVATMEEVMSSLQRTQSAAEPVLDYLKDK